MRGLIDIISKNLLKPSMNVIYFLAVCPDGFKVFI